MPHPTDGSKTAATAPATAPATATAPAPAPAPATATANVAAYDNVLPPAVLAAAQDAFEPDARNPFTKTSCS